MLRLLSLNASYELTVVNRTVHISEPFCLRLTAYLFTWVSPC